MPSETAPSQTLDLKNATPEDIVRAETPLVTHLPQRDPQHRGWKALLASKAGMRLRHFKSRRVKHV